MAKGMTFIIAGPSGVGKGTVIKRVFESGRKLYFSVSATTRAPRPGGQGGVAGASPERAAETRAWMSALV